MSKTTIWSCGSDVTSRELSMYVIRQLGIDVMRTFWYPEVRKATAGMFCWPPSMPYHESELPEVALRHKGRRMVTVSEIIILTLLREVRKGRMNGNDLEILVVYKHDNEILHRRVEVDIKGDLITPWGGNGFFEEGFNLLFN